MVTTVDLLLYAPAPSLTVSVTVYCPLSAYVWYMVLPLPELPSPKSHSYVSSTPYGRTQSHSNQSGMPSFAGRLQEVQEILATGGASTSVSVHTCSEPSSSD